MTGDPKTITQVNHPDAARDASRHKRLDRLGWRAFFASAAVMYACVLLVPPLSVLLLIRGTLEKKLSGLKLFVEGVTLQEPDHILTELFPADVFFADLLFFALAPLVFALLFRGGVLISVSPPDTSWCRNCSLFFLLTAISCSTVRVALAARAEKLSLDDFVLSDWSPVGMCGILAAFVLILPMLFRLAKRADEMTPNA